MCVEQPKRHVHADLIIAWANGAEIQAIVNGEWRDISPPSWGDRNIYRIKPKPPVKKYQWAYCLKRDGLAKATQFYYETEDALIRELFRGELGTPPFHWIQRIDASVKEFPA